MENITYSTTVQEAVWTQVTDYCAANYDSQVYELDSSRCLVTFNNVAMLEQFAHDHAQWLAH